MTFQDLPSEVHTHTDDDEGGIHIQNEHGETLCTFKEVKDARTYLPNLEPGLYRIIRVIEDGIPVRPPDVPTRNVVGRGKLYQERPGARGPRKGRKAKAK